MSGIGTDVGLPLRGRSESDRISQYQLRDRKRKAKGGEVGERRRNCIRRNGLQLLVGAAGFHQYGENVADRNGGFVKRLDKYIPRKSQGAEPGVATELSSVSADARLSMRAFNDRSQSTGAHGPYSEDKEVGISDKDSSHIRRGGFSSSRSSTIGGEIVDWTEESDTTDGSMSEPASISVFDSKVDQEELTRDIDKTAEEMVGDLFDGALNMSDTVRQQTKTQLGDRLLGQELVRTTERRMRRGGFIGGNAGHQDQPWGAPNTVGGLRAIAQYNKNVPRNVIFPISPASPVAPDGRHGSQAQTPDANLCYPMQWRMFYGLDSNWIIQGRDGINTDNSAAANNEKQWAYERSTTLARNYIPFNGHGHNRDIENYPLPASADLVGAGVRPLTLAPRDTELLSILDPATSVQYAFKHPRMSLSAQSQSQQGRKLTKSKLEDYIDSSLSINPKTPTPPPRKHLQAAAMQQQSQVDAQLHGEAGRSWNALANPRDGFYDGMGSKEKPLFPISHPLPVHYNPFSQYPPRRANERASFPMSPVPSADKLFRSRATSVWQGRNLFEGHSATAEPVRLQPMERSEQGPFPISPPALGGPRLTPSATPTPSAIFGSPVAPVSPSPFVDRMDVTPDTTQDVVLTTPGGEHKATAYPVTMPQTSRGGGGARVLMPTVPQTRRVADKAIRAARGKPSFAIRRRKPMG